MDGAELQSIGQRLQLPELLDYHRLVGLSLRQLAGSANAQMLLERLLLCWAAKHPPVIPGADRRFLEACA